MTYKGIGECRAITLTTAIDNLQGTTGDDTFIAGLAAAGQTLNLGDIVDGGAGTDRIDVYGDANIGTFAGATVSNVEQVYAQFDGVTTNAGLNVSANAGVTQAWVSKGTVDGANTVTLTKAQTAGITGTVSAEAGGAADNLTFVFSNSSAAGGDAASLALNAANTTALTDVTIDNIETLNVSATGASRLGTLRDTTNSLSTLNVTGAGSVAATVGSTALRTVNAADNSGGVNLVVTASAAVNQTITGGKGNDSITTTWAGLTNQDKINLGEGRDALITTDAITAATAGALGTKLQGVSNVEELGVNGAVNIAVDASLVNSAIATYSMQTTGASATLTNLANDTTIVAKDGAFVASSAGLKLGANTLNVNLAGGTAAASDLGAGLTVTGSTIINVTSSGTAGVARNELSLTAPDNNTVNVTGSQNLALTFTDATTTGQTVKATGFSGSLIVSGTTKSDAITGGSGNDIITGTVLTNAQATAATIDWAAGGLAASGADELTGGAGNDVFGFSTATVGLANVSTITDFAKGDALAFGLGAAGAGAFVTTAVSVSSAATLADAVALADEVANNVSWFVWQENTYVVVAGATVAAVTDDTIVKLTGVLDLSTSTLAQAATGDILTFA